MFSDRRSFKSFTNSALEQGVEAVHLHQKKSWGKLLLYRLVVFFLLGAWQIWVEWRRGWT
jgi:hypothetical protein